MKQFLKRGMVIALCISMMMSVGCGNQQGEQKNTAMGRYVEELLAFPEMDASASKMLKRSDNTIDVYFFDQKNDSFLLYNTKDGRQWDEKKFPWKVPETEWLTSMAYNKSDEVFVVTNSYAEKEKMYDSAVYWIGANGAAEKLDMKWKNIDSGNAGASGVTGVSASKLSILENGDMIMLQERTGIVQYGQDGSFKHAYEGIFQNYAVSGNKIFIMDSRSNSILVYDTTSFEQRESIPFDNFTDLTEISGGQEGIIYMYNANGVFRLVGEAIYGRKLLTGN